jgi:L-ascorbate metabolism protein UlaG (beta-lactamase superfamily)
MFKQLFLSFVGFALAATWGAAAAGETQVIWHGHATVEIITPKGAVLMIDPWLGNPKNPHKDEKPIESLDRVDYVLLTHGHNDHIADASPIGKKTGARLVGQPELGKQMAKLKGYPGKLMGFDTLMNMGGSIEVADGEVTIAMTPAVHSSGMDDPFAENDDKRSPVVYAGNPAGYVVSIKGGPTIYHTGDTSYFSDMKLIGEMYSPDLALLAAGDHFTMGPKMAARAGQSVQAKLAVPIHWGTFGILAQNMDEFVAESKRLKVNHKIIAPGDKLVYEGKRLKR